MNIAQEFESIPYKMKNITNNISLSTIIQLQNNLDQGKEYMTMIKVLEDSLERAKKNLHELEKYEEMLFRMEKSQDDY